MKDRQSPECAFLDHGTYFLACNEMFIYLLLLRLVLSHEYVHLGMQALKR